MKIGNKSANREEMIVEISCHEVFRTISDYLDNDLDEVLRRRMQEHFKNCQHCRAVVTGAKNVIQLVGDGRAFDVPQGFRTRLYNKLDERLGKTKH
jgi:hypothetical protein